MNSKLFSRDFALVVIGQIISLFGNAIIRFALPLYLLNQTGSSALFGTVTALAFIPSILLAPVGGIIADRINKRSLWVLPFTDCSLTSAAAESTLSYSSLPQLLCSSQFLREESSKDSALHPALQPAPLPKISTTR